MLQEGYMLKTADFAGPQYKIKEKIAELIGEDGMNEFYKAYLKNGITKQDIDFLKKQDSIRSDFRCIIICTLYLLKKNLKEKIPGWKKVLK
jgi:hypothetical protein